MYAFTLLFFRLLLCYPVCFNHIRNVQFLLQTPPELVTDCVKVEIDISFPSSLSTFGNLEIKMPSFDIFEHGISDDLKFGFVDIGTGNGDIYVTVSTAATFFLHSPSLLSS